MDRAFNRAHELQKEKMAPDLPGSRAVKGSMKTPEVYSDDQLRLAAHLYYHDHLGQTSLCKFLHASQATVSRMLSVAQERGLVRFFIERYEARDLPAERRLAQKFGLSGVAVIRTPLGLGPEEARRFVAHFGSAFIASLISPKWNVVVAGGRSIAQLIQRLPEDRQRRVTVLQALGVVDSPVAHVDALELGRSLARRWGGAFMNIDMPAIAPDKRTRDWLLSVGNNRSVRQRLGQADAAIIAVGTPTNSVFANKFIDSRMELSRLRRCGAVGEICGRFFNKEGVECESHWRDQVISVELESLRKFPQVVAIVVGRDRSNAVAAAIRGGLLKSLVIDSEGAQALLRDS